MSSGETSCSLDLHISKLDTQELSWSETQPRLALSKLDTTWGHLTATITALRRLAMRGSDRLCCADQLQKAVEVGNYGEAAHLLEAVQQLAAHFRAFASIPKVAELSGRVAGLEVRPCAVALLQGILHLRSR